MKEENMYKGFEIVFSEYDDKWSCGEYSNVSRKAVKTWIDNIVKTKFERFDAYFKSRYSSMNPVIVQVTAKPEGEESYWIKNAEGKRTKENSKNLFFTSTENTEIFKRIKELQNEWQIINRAIEEQENQLTSLVWKEVAND